jgi:hypothetical protein
MTCVCCHSDRYVDAYPTTEGPPVHLCVWCADGRCPGCAVDALAEVAA